MIAQGFMIQGTAKTQLSQGSRQKRGAPNGKLATSKTSYYTSFQNTEFLLDDKRVLILNETP